MYAFWIPVLFAKGQERLKSTAFIPNCSSQAKTDFLHSKPFLLGQTRVTSFQAIPVRPKLTSFFPSLSSQPQN
jgi:hypothetical protein